MSTRPLNITVLTGSMNGAGAEKTLLTLCKSFIALGNKVTLITLRADGDYVIPDELKLIILSSKKRGDQIKELKSLSTTLDSDLFITSKPEFYESIISKKKICTVHNTLTEWVHIADRSRLRKWKNIKKLKWRYKGKNLVALSEGIKQDLVQNLGCSTEKVKVIPNPYQTDYIASESAQEGPLPNTPYIIYVAALIPRKRHSDLLNAYASSEKLQKFKLVLIGKGSLEGQLKEQAIALQISDQVVFWGWDSNPYRLIRNASLSVLVSEAEGMPRSLIESLIIGRPVMATDCRSGPSEVMTGPLAEYLVPVGDINAIKNSMEKALTEFPDVTGFNPEKFDSLAVAKRYLDLMGLSN